MTNLRVDQYLAWLEHERRYSSNTIDAARADLHRLNELLSHADPACTVDTVFIRGALAKLKIQGLSPRSMSRIASSWRSYFRWEIDFHGRSTHPMTGLKTPKRNKILPKAISPDAAIQLVTSVDKPDAQTLNVMQCQSQVLADLLYGTGMRLSEALSLDVSPNAQAVSWFDWAEKTVFVTGKGNKQRVIPVPEEVIKSCECWLQKRAALLTQPEPFFFVSARGQRLSPRSAQKILAALGVQQGINRHIHPHMLRHSYASHILQSSGDLRAVQELLGHSSIASTQVYTALDFQHLADVYDKAHPRAKQK